MGVIMNFLRSIFVAILDLFRDKDSQNKLSKGAILLWLTFGFLCYFWVKYALMLDPTKPVPNTIPDAPESLMAIFITLLLYIVFPKRADLSNLCRLLVVRLPVGGSGGLPKHWLAPF